MNTQDPPPTPAERALPWLNLLFFAADIAVNALANALPINGLTTGQVSNLYPNLFTPASVTFSIWGLIYALLLLFCGYQASHKFRPGAGAGPASVVRRMGWLFVVSCVCGMAWLLAWHHRLILLSVAVMLLYLATLIAIVRRFGVGRRNVSTAERFFVHVPFNIYLGWISVATAANLTVLLVSWGWVPPLPVQQWLAAAVVATLVAVTLWLVWRNYVFFGLTVVWALAGIVLARYGAEPPHLPVAGTAAAGALLVTAALLLRYRHWIGYWSPQPAGR